MTVGEWKKKRIEEAGGELITYYKIKSSGEYGLCRQTIDKNEYFILNEKLEAADGWKLLEKLMGFDETEPKDSPYRIGNMDVMDDVEKLSEEEFYMQSGADKEQLLNQFRLLSRSCTESS